MSESPTTEAAAHPNPLRAFLEPITGPWTRKNLFSWVRLILLILFIKGCVIDQYSIPSGSMEPTLHGDPRFFRGDRVMVNKWWFGLRIPFSTIYLTQWNKPERWDIVVFKNPVAESPNKILIKRVVGLPGELIGFKKGKLTVNGEVVPFPDSMPKKMFYLSKEDAFNQMKTAESDYDYNVLASLYNQMHYGVSMVEEEKEKFNRVPEGHYMMCGDNTLNSFDSRMYGWVPEENLYGRAFGVWWPWSRRQDFTGFSSTWWGMALMYGIPLALVAMEVFGQWRERNNHKLPFTQ